MILIATLLFFLSFVALILGLILPRLVIRWGQNEKKTRKRVLLYYGGALIFFFFSIGFMASDSTTSTETLAQNVEKPANEEPANPDQDNQTEAKAAETPAEKPAEKPAEEPVEKDPLALAAKGQMDGVEFRLGTSRDQIVDAWGEPIETNPYLGGELLTYNDAFLLISPIDNSLSAIIVTQTEKPVYGVHVGMLPSEIKSILGQPFSEGMNEMTEAWDLTYKLGEIDLTFESEHEEAPTHFVMLFGKSEAQGSSNVTAETETTTSQKQANTSNYGTFVYDDSFNSIYEGELKDGKPHGYGKHYYIDAYGDVEMVYEGEWQHGDHHGKGTLYLNLKTNEGVISGVFENDEPVRYPYPNEFYITREGIVFKGDPSKTKTGDEMTVYYPYGNVYYQGEWENNHINGDGIMYHDYHKLSVHKKGFFEAGRLMGKGEIYYPNGNLRLKGKFKDTFFNGYGLYGDGIEYYENGQIRYEGEFKSDSYHGDGTLYYNTGTIKYEGEWDDGRYDGDGKVYYENGNIMYKGELKNGEPHGIGSWFHWVFAAAH